MHGRRAELIGQLRRRSEGRGVPVAAQDEIVARVEPARLPDATHHFDVVATSTLGAIAGEDETFSTQPSGGEFVLLDSREWELVSPPALAGGGSALEPTSGP